MHPDRVPGTAACLLAVTTMCSTDGERKKWRHPDNVVCCSPASSCMGAPELWKAVPVQELNSMFAAGDFGAHLTSAETKRKLTLRHHWLQTPLVLCLPVC